MQSFVSIKKWQNILKESHIVFAHTEQYLMHWLKKIKFPTSNILNIDTITLYIHTCLDICDNCTMCLTDDNWTGYLQQFICGDISVKFRVFLSLLDLYMKNRERTRLDPLYS